MSPKRSKLPARMMIELLRSGQRVSFVARGSSMWPSVPSGSRLAVEPCAAGELHVGELAAFEQQGEVVVHRVTHVSAEGVQLWGDNRRRSDGVVPPARVLGRATVLERRRLRLRLPSPVELLRAGRSLLRRLIPRRGR